MSGFVDRCVSWWRDNGGLLVETKDILPFVTLHGDPKLVVDKISPLLVGPMSLQQEVVGSSNPIDMRETLIERSNQENDDILSAHRYAVQHVEPILSERLLLSERAGQEISVHYRRVILPVQTLTGAVFVLTCSQRLPVH